MASEMSPEQWGRKAADEELLHFVRGRLSSADADARVLAGMGKHPKPDDAAFLQAKRHRLEQIVKGLEGR